MQAKPSFFLALPVFITRDLNSTTSTANTQSPFTKTQGVAMSAIYNLEPQPTASVIIHTTRGELSVELFAKQTPLTCRNFLQLALDGYYDNTIFHRLVPGFILQGGDPTGTGNGGESIYDGGAFSGDLDPWPMDQRQGKNAGPTGINFKDEFHSRLKFNRRGLLGSANESRPDTNGSQFFFTLDRAEELNGKNTLFGRIAGDTIYNLAKMGEGEVDEATERPTYPVKIERIEILVNPFDDMKKRSRVAAQAPSKTAAATSKDKKKKRKGGKQLLSFGDEEGDDDMPVLKKKKFDTRIVMEDEEEDEIPRKPAKPKVKKPTVMEKLSSVADEVSDKGPRKATLDQPSNEMRRSPGSLTTREVKDQSPEPEAPRKTALERANEEMAALKASMRRTIHAEEPVKEKKKSALESMIPETSIRGRKRRPGAANTSASEDAKTLRMLKAFQSRLEKAPPEKDNEHTTTGAMREEGSTHAPDDEAELCDLHFIANCQSCTSWDKQEKDESDDEGWMSHSLSFAADKLGKDLSNRKKAEEELVVIDPREKARTLKDEKRAARDARQGNSGRAWDQARDAARNAKMAQAASLAGRGAK
ncbi:cyclophilin-like domain-containing protein [Fusarium oxysporum f. sp. albedinis]|nr:cyclophilin-like domain-containing protein [Fusarium oxysporum f. sp. albedinis]KAK2487691.1 Peptidyl-prolyl isomerase cwc27 [Fusarium oxysporum f. sp. albedinis]